MNEPTLIVDISVNEKVIVPSLLSWDKITALFTEDFEPFLRGFFGCWQTTEQEEALLKPESRFLITPCVSRLNFALMQGVPMHEVKIEVDIDFFGDNEAKNILENILSIKSLKAVVSASIFSFVNEMKNLPASAF